MSPKLNVHSFPRPPALQKVSKHVRIVWDGVTIANTTDAYWVLETTHPPTYYLPPSSIDSTLLSPSTHSSFCEWKGRASYYNLEHPTNGQVIQDRAWYYKSPTPGFQSIKDYVAFYAGPWDCYVDDEHVVAQPGDFYGGWMTSDIEGTPKGGPGTWGW